MRITITTAGSLGDVRPYVALGAGLQAAGHTVRLATHAPYAALAREHGLDFFPTHADPRSLLAGDAGHALMRDGSNPLQYLRHMRDIVDRVIGDVLTDYWQACRDADAIVHSYNGLAGYRFADLFAVPSIGAYYLPFSPTRAFPFFPVYRWRHLGGSFNRLTYAIGEQIQWQTFRPGFNRWLRDYLGAPPVSPLGGAPGTRDEARPLLYGFSRHVVPRPPDWPARLQVTGYWFLGCPPGWQPPAALADFLAAGPPPISVGFGSMQADDAAGLTDLVVRAADRVRRRVVLLTGWGALAGSAPSDDVFLAESVPHDWLFPRVAAVVHHGGAGTTAAALRAGRPSVIVPFIIDQPFWGARVAALGVGPKPIPRKHLTVERLAAAMRIAVSDRAMQARAAALGQRIQAEDGVGRAVEGFHRTLESARKPSGSR